MLIECENCGELVKKSPSHVEILKHIFQEMPMIENNDW